MIGQRQSRVVGTICTKAIAWLQDKKGWTVGGGCDSVNCKVKVGGGSNVGDGEQLFQSGE
jgi:hypothetical protein